jgi:hypothetical protein
LGKRLRLLTLPYRLPGPARLKGENMSRDLPTPEERRQIRDAFKNSDPEEFRQALKTFTPERLCQIYEGLKSIRGYHPIVPVPLAQIIANAVSLALAKTPPENERPNPAPAQAVIISLGNKRYQIDGSQPVTLEFNQDVLLQAFLEKPSMNKRQLIGKTFTDAPRVLKRLKEKYPDTLGQAITLPGGRGKGGYFVHIRSAKS